MDFLSKFENILHFCKSTMFMLMSFNVQRNEGIISATKIYRL